ncbi:ribokinase [Sagittula sp. NFXS13]|uniref:ribokinase n=1 Tax=Sagittula sp. NFXS13 TaxID=2819095 RepID=UPI0032DEDECD
MTIFNLGSINADIVYRVPHLPLPGETLSTTGFQRGLGGKGANMSIAAARAAGRVVHIGAVGRDGDWAVQSLMESGVHTQHIQRAETTGHAIIYVDETGENTIVIHPGANREISMSSVIAALSEATQGDTFVTQNETNMQADAVRIAASKGMRVAYAAAPFDADAIQAVLGDLDLLVLNQVEAQQLETATGQTLTDIGVPDVVMTLGAKGCRWFHGKQAQDFSAHKVTPVDTTGAGDTFTGYLLAGLDRGEPMEQAIRLAQKAGALMVQRQGTADVIPDLKDVRDAFPS